MTAKAKSETASPYEQQVQDATASLRKLEADAAALIDSAPEAHKRGLACFRTKLQEARLWLTEAQEG